MSNDTLDNPARLHTPGVERLLTDLGVTVESWLTPDPEPEPEEYERFDGMS